MVRPARSTGAAETIANYGGEEDGRGRRKKGFQNEVPEENAPDAQALSNRRNTGTFSSPLTGSIEPCRRQGEKAQNPPV